MKSKNIRTKGGDVSKNVKEHTDDLIFVVNFPVLSLKDEMKEEMDDAHLRNALTHFQL